ncbi:MAG: tetratricopeptide repeat protein [Ferruginibacter sp.]|nr:tetratricopeptide repeat protein [Ferruginibacter sp.]
MKKNTLYAALLILFVGAAGFVITKSRGDERKRKAAVYQLLDRKGLLSETNEWATTQKNASKLLAALKTNSGDTKSMIGLANLFILEARATGNYQYYDKAAMKYVNDVLAKDPNHFEALTLKSLLYLSQHHFADGLAMAEGAEKINPYNAFLYGILVDGHVEMGNYDSAVSSAEKMMSIRPDLRSFARASYLREIHGDYPGAIEAMKLAIDAGLPGDEATEWSRVQLGHLYENTGDLKNAEMNYSVALGERPGFVHAMAGMARLALAAKDYNKAISFYQQADSLVNDFSFKEELVDVYQLAGQKDKAAAMAKIVIDEMNINAVASASDESIGHYADRELAYAYLKVSDYDKALQHALAEYNRRPKNIEVNETLAWVYYQKGDFAKALPYIRAALKTNSKNPVLLCRAGLVYEKAGDKAKAREYLTEAFKNHPNIPESLKQSSEDAFKKISG